jgi:hypothetical protein
VADKDALNVCDPIVVHVNLFAVFSRLTLCRARCSAVL